MITVNGKDRYTDIEIRVLEVDGRKPIKIIVRGARLKSIFDTRENPGVLPSIGSLRSSNCQDISTLLCLSKHIVILTPPLNRIWTHIPRRPWSSQISFTYRDGFVSQGVLPQQRNRLLHARPGRAILMKKVAGEKDKVDLAFPADLQDFAEGV